MGRIITANQIEIQKIKNAIVQASIGYLLKNTQIYYKKAI